MSIVMLWTETAIRAILAVWTVFFTARERSSRPRMSFGSPRAQCGHKFDRLEEAVIDIDLGIVGIRVM
jgi:hypothetical protein